MLCPYCTKNTAAKTPCIHCKEPIPRRYIELHRKVTSQPPVLVSVVGDRGHGKTNFLAALVMLLEHGLPAVLKRENYSCLQISVSKIANTNADKLRNNELPEGTRKVFPEPSIYRLEHYPGSIDRTLLIYDPSGEAFRDASEMQEYATFIRASHCVLLLISLDPANMKVSPAEYMVDLLKRYIEGVTNIGGQSSGQHLVVVFTKADLLNISERYQGHVSEQIQRYIAASELESIRRHKTYRHEMAQISALLEDFTRNVLGAHGFANLAKNRNQFASVHYTAVSALGAPPDKEMLTLPMSDETPRRVVDPLIWALDTAPRNRVLVRYGILAVLALVALTALLVGGAFALVPKVENIASTSTVDASSSWNNDPANYDPDCLSPIRAVDGVVDGDREEEDSWGQRCFEWATSGERERAWIRLTFERPVRLNSIRLYDRVNLKDNVVAGVLRFSDGTQREIGALPNDGQTPLTLEDVPREAVRWVELRVTKVSDETRNVGVAEIELFGREATWLDGLGFLP